MATENKKNHYILGYPVAEFFNATEHAPTQRTKWKATANQKWDFTTQTWSHWVVTWSSDSGVSLFINGSLWARDVTSQPTNQYAKDTMFIGRLMYCCFCYRNNQSLKGAVVVTHCQNEAEVKFQMDMTTTSHPQKKQGQ